MRRGLAVAALAALVAAGAPQLAAGQADRLGCQVARFSKTFEAIEDRDAGFPRYDFEAIDEAYDSYVRYADGALENYDDHPSQGWTLTEERVTGTGSDAIYDAEFNVIGRRPYSYIEAKYERVDPEALIRPAAIRERAKVKRLLRTWQRGRAGVMRYSKRTSSYSHRWLVRRDPAFRASARATRRQLSAAIGAPTDVATVRKAVAQVSRFDDALDALQLRMPYASLFSCYR